MEGANSFLCDIRIGHGYDAHRLVPGRMLILGGVQIEYRMGLLGHSDADVLTHAVIDSLLGASGQGDIGRLFPDTDVEFKDISSLVLLGRVVERIRFLHCAIINIDCTVIAQEPKLAKYITAIEKQLSSTLAISQQRVNVKATTEEGLGFTGLGEGIAAHAICLISQTV